MRLIWWAPEGSDAQNYVDEAIKYNAEIQVGRSEFIDPYLENDYKTARLIEVPTITQRMGISSGGAKVGNTIMLTYDDESTTDAVVEFMIEQQDLNTKEWKHKETLSAERLTKWTQARGVAYDELGFYRATVLVNGEPIEGLQKRDFFFHE